MVLIKLWHKHLEGTTNGEKNAESRCLDNKDEKLTRAMQSALDHFCIGT